MRRVVFQCVSAVGVLLAVAIFGLGPSASAAYLPASDASSSPGLGSDPTDDTPDTPIDSYLDRGPAPVGHLLGGGGMAPSGGNPSPSSPPAAGLLTRPGLPADGLVVYFREPAAALQLSAFTDPILDPPRRA